MTHPSQQDTSWLLSKVSQGNENAFELLIKQYEEQLYGRILSYTRCEELTQEMVQDVFLKVWMNRSCLIEIDSFKSYLFVIARNYTYDCLKQIKRKKKREMEWLSERPDTHGHEDEDAATYHQVYKEIVQTVKLLPPQQKKIYVLRSKGMSKTEIAEQLGISPETVKKHIYLGKRFLKNRLRGNSLTGLKN